MQQGLNVMLVWSKQMLSIHLGKICPPMQSKHSVPLVLLSLSQEVEKF